MNVIGGVICADPGRAAVEGRSLADRFAKAGCERGDFWSDERCALYVSAATSSSPTPSVVVTRRFVAVADAHFPDVDALSAGLGISPTSSSADIVLAAFERWGAACCERLTGDFAFMVYDRLEAQLFGARDRFGVRPVYLREENGYLSFASDVAVLSSGLVDRGFVGGFLAGLVEDETQTADPKIQRLAPAHLFQTDASNPLKATRYWSLGPEAPPPPKDVVDAFRERFSRAVARSLGAPSGSGVLLSGGIDSTSIATIAARLGGGEGSVPSFSLVFPTEPEVDEERYVDLVANRAGLRATKLIGTDIAPLHRFEAERDLGPASFTEGPGGFRLGALFEKASATGVGVLLDGHGGDEVVWTGYRRAIDLARDRRVLRALAQVRGLSRVSGEDPFVLAATIIGVAAPRNRAGSLVRRVVSGYRRRRLPANGSPGAGLDLLADDFVRESNLVERVALMEEPAPASDAQAHAAALSSPRNAYAFESLRNRSARAGIELRFPFFDVDLVSFCLGLPSKEKLRAGWPRSVLRRAMDPDLPRAVCWRRDKTDFGPSLARGLVRWHRPLLDELVADRDGAMSEYYRMDALRELVARLLNDPTGVGTVGAVSVWRAAYLRLASRPQMQ